MSIYIIAEIGINHDGSLATCKRLIDAAKDAGADSVKFQKRTIEAVYTQEELQRPRESPFGTTNRDLKEGLEFDEDDYAAIARYCKDRGVAWSASCWDRASVSFMGQFDPPWLKIPSALITDRDLLAAYRETTLPLLVSTGMSAWEEIDDAVSILGLSVVKSPLTLLHCHSSYPSPLEEINLACIRSFQERYPDCRVGYSSHTVSPWPCLMAAVYGAEVIEAHLTLDRAACHTLADGSTWRGSDHAASLEPAAFKKMVTEIRTWEVCKGDGEKRVYPSEAAVKAKLRKV